MRPKNPIVAILWCDAAYTYQEKIPKGLPLPQLTCGFIIKATEEYVDIAVNSYYNSTSKAIQPVDGVIIPKKSIIEFRVIDFYEQTN